MKARKIKENIYWLGAVDWDRRLFDSLIPLPDGTSYNAYIIQGSEKTVLFDSADPSMIDVLLFQLKEFEKIDYIVSHHAEQDHSGSIPTVLKLYPDAKVIVTEKCRELLVEHLLLPEEKFIVVADGEKISLGNKTLEFIHTPWVHWPETMVTYLHEDHILFSCDFFGSHIATTDLFVKDEALVYEAAKRYFAEIMMPFSEIIKRNIEKIKNFNIEMIAPSHGPIYDNPSFIIEAYKDWISDGRKNVVVIPYVSMHDSTKVMVQYLVSLLAEKGITVYPFNLTVTDIGKLAITLVDAATVVLGTPTVHAGPHPLAVYATYLLNALRPKIKYISIIGSYGWHSKAVDMIVDMTPKMKKVEVIEPVMVKGYPKEKDFEKLADLANKIAEKHKNEGLL